VDISTETVDDQRPEVIIGVEGIARVPKRNRVSRVGLASLWLPDFGCSWLLVL
jgi:hypothetical protein